MGILKDGRYWGRVINRIEDRRPTTRHDVMRPGDAVAVVREACRAFSDLVEDPDFESDVREAVETAERAQKSIPPNDHDFRGFLESFLQVERQVLWQSGVSERATVRIEAELGNLLRACNNTDLERVADKIKQMRALCCDVANDPSFAGNPRPDLFDDIREALNGTAIIGADVATSVLTGGFYDLFIGTSVNAGLVKFRPIVRRIW